MTAISRRETPPGQTGAFGHIAFAMEGSHKEMEQKLNANSIPFQSRLPVCRERGIAQQAQPLTMVQKPPVSD